MNKPINLHTMKSKITNLLLMLLWMSTMFTTACSDDDQMTEVMLDDIVLNLTSEEQDQQIDIPNFDEIINYWHIYSPTSDSWVTHERIPGRKSLYVALNANTTNAVRSSYIMVRSKSSTQRIVINQDHGSKVIPLSTTSLSISEDGDTRSVTITDTKFLADIKVVVGESEQSWLTASVDNDVIRIDAAPNTEPTKRSGKITVSAVRTVSQTPVEAVIDVTQGGQGIPPFHINIPTDWSETWVYTVEANGKPVAQITKEFLCLENVIKAQAIVVYPTNDEGEVLISQGGYIAEILLNSDDKTVDPTVQYTYTVPTGDVHGGTVKFNLSNYAADLATNSTGNASGGSSSQDIPTLNQTEHFSYTPGQAEAAKEIWMLDDQFMTSYSKSNAIETTVQPYIVSDNRGEDDNFTYGVVKVGCQYWLNSNLKASHWNKNKDFAAIPLVSDGWSTKTKASFITVFNEDNDFSILDAVNRNLYGVLYSYLAIGGFSSLEDSGVNNADDLIADNISPEGWIVPSLPECITMGAYTGGILACGRLDLPTPYAPENNIVGFNGRKAHYFYSSKYAYGSNFDAQYQTRTYAGSNACYWIESTSKMTMCKNRGDLTRLNLIRCINNGAIKTR